MPKKTAGSSRKIGRRSTEEYLATLRPWEDEEEIRAGKLPDRRPWYARHTKSEGIPSWQALYFFTRQSRAEELYQLDLMGYGDPGNRDPDWPEGQLADFDRNHFLWKMYKSDLEELLIGQLKEGKLIAKGFNSNSSLDAGRQAIAKERWEDFELDIKASIAKNQNVVVTQILIFESAETKRKPSRSSARVPSGALRKWYVNYIEACERKRLIPDRDQEFSDARKQLGEGVTRTPLRLLRKELAPEVWKRRGRRRGTPNCRVGDTPDTFDA